MIYCIFNSGCGNYANNVFQFSDPGVGNIFLFVILESVLFISLTILIEVSSVNSLAINSINKVIISILYMQVFVSGTLYNNYNLKSDHSTRTLSLKLSVALLSLNIKTILKVNVQCRRILYYSYSY